jgi:hypothetical protein
VLLGEADGVLAVGCLGDDREALLLEHLLEVEPDERLVLGDDDPPRGAPIDHQAIVESG